MITCFTAWKICSSCSRICLRRPASGEIMPDIPEMKRFWALFSSRLGAMFKGEKPIAATLEEIAQRLRAAGEVQAWRRRHYPTADSAAGPS